MNEQDRLRFAANYRWFNDFLRDLHHLFENISDKIPNRKRDWYYQKSNYLPEIPSYYMMGLTCDRVALQCFAVLNADLIAKQTAFKSEPSIILVQHSQPDKALYIEDYGLRVLKNKDITALAYPEDVVGGQILRPGGQNTSYFAFQVLLDVFSVQQDIPTMIDQHIVAVLQRLPEFPPESL